MAHSFQAALFAVRSTMIRIDAKAGQEKSLNVRRDLKGGNAGQEKKWVPGAQHTSCTIEMTNTQKRVDVAVVDEVQVGHETSNPHPTLPKSEWTL